MYLFALLCAILDYSLDFVAILSLPFMCLSAVQINDKLLKSSLLNSVMII